MAIGGKQSRQGGWQDQAARLALKHTVLPRLPKLATEPEPALRPVSPALDGDRSSLERPAEERDPTAGNPFSREETLEWIQNARKAVLSVRAEGVKVAEERIAELEASLEAEFARAAFLENENQSLQESLDARASENLDLVRRLAESEARGDEVRSELQSSEVTRTEYDLATAAAARKIELLENLVAVKEARLQKLEQARKKVQEDTSKLLATTRMRDKALAEAEQRISVLTELFEQLEFSLEAGKIETVSRQIQQAIDPQPVRKEPVVAKNTGRQFQIWQRPLDTDDWLLAGPAKRKN